LQLLQWLSVIYEGIIEILSWTSLLYSRVS
jgi:hypothetical protein